MVIKINYTSSDVYVSTSVSPVYVVVNYSGTGGGGGGAIWGGITGTLSDQTDLQTALDGKVPYTGATANVNLGEFELKAGQLTLDISPTGTAAVATTRWNDTAGITETTLKGGNVILKNGVDLVARVVNKVTPNATLTKAAYQAVRISGAQGQRLAVAFAQANNDANSADTIGLVCETIPTNQEGFIMTMGQLENINTTGSLQGETWADGDVLYLSPTTPGAITKVKPTGAGHIVVIGYVEYAHVNNGKIYVKVMNGWELEELHNVDIVTPANNEALIYESSTALWKNKTIATALGFTPISGTGATGQVAYWNGTNSQTGSNNLFWDAANARLGIGTNAPAFKLDVNGTARVSTSLDIANGKVFSAYNSGGTNDALKIACSNTGATFGVQNTNATGFSGIEYINNSGTVQVFTGFNNNNNQEFRFNNIASGGYIDFLIGSTSGLRIFNTRNIGINTTTDGGQRLQVYGDAFVRGSGNTSATQALTVQNSDSGNLFRVFNNGLIGIGNSSDRPFIFTFTTGAGGNNLTGTNLSFYNYTSTQSAIQGNFSFENTASAQTSGANSFFRLSNTFAPTSGTGSQSILFLQNTINQSGGANGITRGLYVNPTLTAAADWRSIEWSNNSGWGLYGAGTSANYFGGNLSIATTNTPRRLNINQALGGNCAMIGLYASGGDFVSAIGAQVTTNNLQFASTVGILFYTGSTIGGIAAEPTNERMRLTAAGRLLLGTASESTFLLDVNGTARVSGLSTLASFRVGTTNASNAPFIFTFDWNPGSPDGSFRNLSFYNYTESAQATGGAFAFAGNNFTQTSGSQIFINTVNSFTPTSGTASLSLLRLAWTINQTGGANGITRGLYIQPTLTAAADWRAIEVSSGVSVLAPSSTASATLRIPSGTAPTSPVNGDIWFDGTDLKMRIGGVTKTFTLV